MIQSQAEALHILEDTSLAASEREIAILYLREHPSAEAAARLVQRLEDHAPGVRWAAAITLARYGDLGLRPLLRALTQTGINAQLREGAHRVLARNPSSLSSGQLQELLEALQGLGTNVATMSTAVKLLRLLD